MYLRVRELLTDDQRIEFTKIQDGLDELEMAAYFSLSVEDIEIINRHRRDYNRLGFACQLCTLRFNGWPLTSQDDIPESVLKYICNQININFKDFTLYFQREATRFEHLEEIRQVYGYKNFSNQEYHYILKYTLKQALENGNATHLIRLAIDELKRNKIIMPAISTIERAVWEARKKAEERIYKVVNEVLNPEQKTKLDGLLEPTLEKGKTKLSLLKELPGSHSSEAFLKIIERLECVRDLNLNINITGIHYNRFIQLSRLGERYEPHSFRRFDGSKRYAILVIFLLELSQDLVDHACLKDTKLAVGLSYDTYIKERQESLLKRITWVSQNIDTLEGVNLEKGEIHVKRLDKDTPEEAKSFSLSLSDMLPRVKLTDLLLEVANWTNFDEQFTHASIGQPPKDDEKEIIMAALIAMGTNIGLSKMADTTPGISYHQMANTAQWRMYDDTLTRAQATLVNFQHRLSLPSYWGDGSTSSSDGMRIITAVPSLHGEHNPHYGSEKEATIYRFVSDQYSAFYTKVINTNARDAVHVIDGLLHHETELDIKEHYTDTAGYTDQVFELSHLLRFKFAPRLRDISEVKLYSFSKPSDYPKLENILQGKINIKLIQDNYDDVLRLTHSIREGKVSASLIMGNLGSYARKNSHSMALREMGRIEKTIFILDYISSEAFRRRIQKGLNKGEATNALARALFFGKRGEFYELDIQDQLQRASTLIILINAISVWNTVYLSKAIDYLRANGSLNEELLSYISPLSWEHINFYGKYNFNLINIPSLDKLRPLNISGTQE